MCEINHKKCFLKIKQLSEHNDNLHSIFSSCSFTDLSNKNLQNVYSKLAKVLLTSDSEVLWLNFKNEFLFLLNFAIPLDASVKFNYEQHLLNCIVLAKIINVHPDAKNFILKYFSKYPAPFDDTEKLTIKRLKNENKNVDDVDIVKASYEFLKLAPDFFISKWNWSAFIEKFLDNKNKSIKWFCCQCVALITNMNEKQFDQLVMTRLNTTVIEKFRLSEFNKSNNLTVSNLKIKLDKVDLALEENTDVDVSNSIVCISGIYLNKHQNQIVDLPNLVEVESTRNNLRKIALGISSCKTVYLQGPVGCGKTILVQYLASKTGRVLGDSFIKVQLGDQTDSKMLLGSYICTDIPGEFIWQPGVLTQAVMDGSWLLLEDLDSASLDIASVLNGLLESGSLTVPGYHDSIPVTSGFQLFLTQRLVSTVTGFRRNHSHSSVLLEKHSLQINIDPLTETELIKIIEVLYPALKTIAKRMVDVYSLFNTQKSLYNKNNRLTSTRDLFKWCSRAIIDYDVSDPNSGLKVLQDGIDIFCGSYANNKDLLLLAESISTHLGIINTQANYFCTKYKPDCFLTSGNFKIGRVNLPRSNALFNKPIKFCFTRPSACLLERIACCIKLKEPVLLVGETGTGKTSCVQYLASTVGQKLIVINMNQQSDSADLLGGFKPVDIKFIIAPIKQEFENIFNSFFNVEQNKKFLGHISYCFNTEKWFYLVKLMRQSYEAAINRLNSTEIDVKLGQKRQFEKTNENKNEMNNYFLEKWLAFGIKLRKLELQLKQKHALAFAFIKGSLVKAIENGDWVLLDEINLANAETLECLSGLLENTKGSLSLLEKGDKKPIARHPNFTLFACMNPSTDVGKKDLPAGLRNRFTEFFVDELTDQNDLLLLVNSYLEALSLPQLICQKIVKFYLEIRKSTTTTLTDGLGHKPHFSLRSLCRALTIASKNPCGTFTRSLYEAFQLSFLTQLDENSYKVVKELIIKYVIGSNHKSLAAIKQPISKPKTQENIDYLQIEGYWIQKGDFESKVPKNYVLTETVRRNLKDLIRIVAIGKFPVLLQGETSVGKTSLITYLAEITGNKYIRINNHEHTDLQEYIGSYMADSSGKLVFREGLLVEAMRKGYWIILDELNLAPTDVLEALNRVLDDNRELFIPETQVVVKAHPNFMLFATQNPPGLYGGRKMLSRAFRNRFVELHFNEIPLQELEIILHQRCNVPQSYAKKMLSVMKDLQMRRRGSAAFAGKQGFITLRDLFRWGERYNLAKNVTNKLYDWDQHLADEGYLVLAGKVRNPEEKNEILQVLQKRLKRDVLPENLFTLSENTSPVTKEILLKIDENRDKHKNIVWTFNMRQLGVLVFKALKFNEPVLLVGETGGGKTTICKLLADFNGQELTTLNCNLHSESSDFIGGLRPVRDHDKNENRLFEWVDGPLIIAMTNGHVFLCDEISLAEDSVLERLNSLLEPERSLLLAEKGFDMNSDKNTEYIVADKKFRFIATMNPGGDFGKKELSIALRNRFTEIWCETCTDRNDLIEIIERNIKIETRLGNDGSGFGKYIMDFVEWFKSTEIGKRFTISIRDLCTWTSFINIGLNNSDAYFHGACLTFLDSLGSGVTAGESSKVLENFRKLCYKFISDQLECNAIETSLYHNIKIEKNVDSYGIRPFFIKIGDSNQEKYNFSFETPTTNYNTLRLLRAMQLNKPILLEGSPGVGKTSLVIALAKHSGHKIVRINLSDQTDVSDLFGADLPVEGTTGGHFSWKDGPLLQALKQQHWILLDELNLATQSVLEGLNACLDHRGEVYIPELGKTFYIKPGTRIFACQNPLKQGGSRRGLPKSFLNRFIQVYISPLNENDLYGILINQFPEFQTSIIEQMVKFNTEIVKQLDEHVFGNKGAPWDYNLRDLIRWCELTIYHFNLSGANCYSPESTVYLIYSDRMRTQEDKIKVQEIFESVFQCKIKGDDGVAYINKTHVCVGDVKFERDRDNVDSVFKENEPLLVLRTQLNALRSVIYCVNLNWMSILVGGAGSGKSCVVKTLANLAGKTLQILPVTSAMDTTEILGGFEQTNYIRHLQDVTAATKRILFKRIRELFTSEKETDAIKLLSCWEEFTKIQDESNLHSMADSVQHFLERIRKLSNILDTLSSVNVPNESIIELNENLQTLMHLVKTEGSLNAGGKFEWVDSLLIKCLRDGSWLLIDNVNLCSPAVLDRLNALLEPNGTLTIGERGVDKDGKMYEIIPHKDFRLFLAMDPKNGEISRAMKNRGVEIFILETENELDIKSLISNVGLKSKTHINSILEIHNYASNIILGEKPNITHLLQASFLISRQVERGINFKDAFKNSVQEMYIKNKNSDDLNSIDGLDSIQVLLNSLLDKINNEDELFNQDVTVNTVSLQLNCEVAKLKQQSSILQQFLKNDCKNNLMLTYLIMLFYSMSSKDDIKLRHEYLQIMLKKHEEDFLTNVNYYIYTNIKDILNPEPFDLPQDYRWIRGVVYPENATYTTNCLNFLMYFLIRYMHERENEKKIVSRNNLLQKLRDIHKKKIEDDLFGVVAHEIINLLNCYDKFIKSVISSKTLQITDENLVDLMSILKWRFIPLKSANVNLQDVIPYNEINANFQIQYKWFYKYCILKFCEILKIKPNNEVQKIIDKINSSLQKEFSVLSKIKRNYQKFIDNRPLPVTDERTLEILETYKMLTKNFNKIIDDSVLHLKEYKEFREACIDFNITLNCTTKLQETIIQIQKINEQKTTTYSKELKTLLITDYLSLLQIFSSRCLKEANLNENFLKNTVTLPVILSTALIKYLQTNDDCLDYEIRTEMFQYFIESKALKIRIVNDENECIKEIINVYAPVLSFLITDVLIVNSKIEYKFDVPSLDNFRDNLKRQRALSLSLWKNMNQIGSYEYDLITNESKYVKASFQAFLYKLAHSLGITDFEDDLKKLSNLCVQHIQDLCNTSEIENEYEKLFLISLIRDCCNEVFKLNNNNELTKQLNICSNIYILLNYLKFMLNSELPLIDYIVKMKFKKKYYQENQSEFNLLKKTYVLQNKVFSASDKSLHAYVEHLTKHINYTEEKIVKYSQYKAIRPEDIPYSSVFNIVRNASTSILKPKNISKLYVGVNQKILDLQAAIHSKSLLDLSDANNYLRICDVNISSCETALKDLEKLRYFYPDVIEPILNNLAEYVYGVNLKMELLKKLIAQYQNIKNNLDLQKCLENLIKFPVLDDVQSNYAKQIVHYDEYFKKYLQNVLNKKEYLRLLKCHIQENFNWCILHGKHSNVIDKSVVNNFNALVGIFIEAYNKQEKLKENLLKENESLYKIKTVSIGTETEEDFMQLFYNYASEDFADFEHDKDEDTNTKPEAENTDVITYDDLNYVCKLHILMIQHCTKSEWLNPKQNSELKENFLYSLTENYKLFKLILDKSIVCLDYKLDAKMLPGINVLLNNLEEYGAEKNVKLYNFYEDSNVEEVKSCYHILKELQLRINELLENWNDNPVLVSIETIIKRILGFPITSPLARFLSGFELLLNKCHMWEQNAHSGVSLLQNNQAITQQIITWKKLELNMWKNCLTNVQENMRKSIAKWWTHLYLIMQQFINDDKIYIRELIETLQKFITESNFAEFEDRVNLLFVFHCYALNLKNTKRKKQFLNILWNLHSYFVQFCPVISNKIKEFRAPIEKKLKDQVKIIKWKDINYWTVQNIIQKIHKILNKYVREFQIILKKPVQSFLTNTENLNQNGRNAGIVDNKLNELEKSLYLTKLMVNNKFSKSAKTLEILKSLSAKTIDCTQYSFLIEQIEEFINQTVDVSNNMQNTEINRSLPKQKQISQAKSALQVKRRNLNMIFKNLNKLGLSFKIGVVLFSSRDDTTNFIVKPIDLKASIEHMDIDSLTYKNLLNTWNNCELFYNKSLMQMDVLETALKSPASDLGIQNIERCKGFAFHSLHLMHQQKIKVIKTTRLLYYIQYYLSSLNQINYGKQFLHVDVILKLEGILMNSLVVMEQYKMILNSCPNDSSFGEDLIEIPILPSKSVDCLVSKNSETWQQLFSDAEIVTNTVTKIIIDLEKSKKTIPSEEYDLIAPKYIEFSIKQLINNLNLIVTKLSSAECVFKNVSFVSSLKWLSNSIKNIKTEITIKTNGDLEHLVSLKDFSEIIDKLMKKIKLILQNMYKKYVDCEKINAEDTFLCQEHLSNLIISNLFVDIDLLDMKNVLKLIHDISSVMHSSNPINLIQHKNIIQSVLPHLDQIILLFQYYVTQQISAYKVTSKMTSFLLNMFINLVTKGFGLPPDLTAEIDAEGQSESSGGMGLGDGEGERDVSDRIESEDQLEDTQLPGEEKNDNNDDEHKEEKNGIEMSEDFDSKLEDVNKDENEEDDSDSDADDQMDETDKNAEQLDKELWGSDEEDGEEDNKDDVEEDKSNKGAQEGEKELSAKESNSLNPENEDDNTNRSDKKEKKEINELDEPDLDDNQIDPYHHNQTELPEPEPMDLPDDMTIDEGQGNNEEIEEENPFDVDKQLDDLPPNEKDETNEEIEDDNNKDEGEEGDDKSDLQDDNKDVDEAEDDDETEADKTNGIAEENHQEDNEQKENNEIQSTLDETQSKENNLEVMDVDNSDNVDNVQANKAENQKSSNPTEELSQENSKDKEGVGQSQMEESKSGHVGQTNAQLNLKTLKNEKQEKEKKRKPGESDEQRSLGDVTEPVKKKLKTLNIDSNETDSKENNEEHDENDIYQHIKEAKETDNQVLDTATKEQAEAQKDIPEFNKESEDKDVDPSTELPEEEDAEIEEVKITEETNLPPQKTDSEKKTNKNQHKEGEITEETNEVEVEGDIIKTSTVSRGYESAHHTRFDVFKDHITSELSAQDIINLKREVEMQLSKWNKPPPNEEAEKAWQKISSVTSSLAQQLCEQLRLVLEPTQASRLKGDYRTGKRINMRKVIPYIASDFRKDKIWLRRTKPSKREYQIVVAVDDSASMANNNSKELAFESIALISKALTLLESGQLSILSFGEETEILHNLNEPFTEKAGATLLQKFQFSQKKTYFHKVVDFANEMLSNSQLQTNSVNAKLFVIISDGRGINTEGDSKVRQAVRRAMLSNIFLIFIIIDNPDNRDSILDLSVVLTGEGSKITTKPYMDCFPFPFYVILRDINLLPNVLSDALRQWFEIVSNIDKQ